MKLRDIARVLAVAVMMWRIAVPAAAQSGSMPDPEPPAVISVIAPVAHAERGDLVPASTHLAGVEPALAQTLPNAPSCTTLDGKQKFQIFLRQAYSPFTFVTTAFDAGLAQLSDDWPAYGQGMEGYGKRYGA